MIKYDELLWQQSDLALRDGESGARWVNKMCVSHINTLIRIGAQIGMNKGAHSINQQMHGCIAFQGRVVFLRHDKMIDQILCCIC